MTRSIVGFFAAFVAAALIIQPPAWAGGGAAVPTAAPPVRRTLSSGMRLIVVTQPDARITALDLCVRAGSAQDAPNASGAAHMVEHLVFKGTDTRPPGRADADIEALGGELTARTGRDWTRYATTLPAGPQWRDALAVVADIMRHPAFRPADVDAERGIIRAEIDAARSEPMRVGYADVTETAWGPDEAYHLPLMGTDDSLARLTADDLRAFWRAWYRPDNMTLVVTGNVTPDEAAQAAAALFPPAAAAVAGAPPAPPVAVTATTPAEGIVRAAPRPSVVQADRDLVTVFLGFRTPPALAEAPAADVLAPLLSPGGSRGRLGQALIEKQGLAVAVSAEFLPGRNGGLFILTATGDRREAARLERALSAEVARLREDPLSDSEVAEARAVAVGDLRYVDETAAGRARHLALWDAFAIPPVFADDYAAHLAAVRTDDVRRFVAQGMTAARYSVAEIGPVAPGSKAAAGGEGAP